MSISVYKFLLAGDRFMPELHLSQPGFTYSSCGPFTKHRGRIQNFKETGDLTGDLKHIYQNELDKGCFAHDAAYSKGKDLDKISFSDKSLKNRVYEIALNPKCSGYQRGLASMVYNIFENKTGSG